VIFSKKRQQKDENMTKKVASVKVRIFEKKTCKTNFLNLDFTSRKNLTIF